MKFERMTMNQGGNASFLKIEDNGNVTMVLRGEILTFYQDWPKGGEKKVFDKPTPGAGPRYKVNAIVYEDKKFVAKVWEFPPTVSNMLADIADSYEIENIKIKVTKIVQGERTSYMVLPLVGPKDVLSPKQLKEIDAVELNTLSISPTATTPAAPLKEYAPSDDDDEGLPF
jgi:hypothetical protein